MRLASFKSVLDAAARNVGLAPSSLSPEDAEQLATLISDAVKTAWEWGKDWPEWCPVEQVPFIETWATSTAYSAGATVWHAADGRFYLALTSAAAGLTPPDNPAVWEATDAPAARDFATVFGVYAADPRTDRYALRLDWTMTPDGALIPACASVGLSSVWIHYRPAAPGFSAAAWDDEAAYAALAIVYDGAECYMATASSTGKAPASNPTLWSLRPLPSVLAEYAADSAAAKWLRSRAQYDAAARLAADAEFALIRAYDRARGYGRRI